MPRQIMLKSYVAYDPNRHHLFIISQFLYYRRELFYRKKIIRSNDSIALIKWVVNLLSNSQFIISTKIVINYLYIW